MPRLATDALCYSRRDAVLADAILGEIPLKAIAAKHGIAESTTRNIVWAAGYHAMIVSAEERGRILAARRIYAKASRPAPRPLLMPKAGVCAA